MTTQSKAFSLVHARPGQTVAPAGSRARLAAVAGRGRDSEPVSTPGLVRGVVQSQGTAGVLVALDQGCVIEARRAAGCLLRPEPGDTVLVHAPEAGEAYLLCVLEKAAGAAVLDASQDLRIQAAGRLELAAPEVRLHGKAGRFDFLGLDLLVGALTTKAGSISSVAAAVDSRVGDLTQTIRLAVRQVETEVVRAGGIRQFIRDRFLVRSGQTTIIAQDDVTVDAKKINLG
jgi:hypothetical protein